jgi:hypothetical protein
MQDPSACLPRCTSVPLWFMLFRTRHSKTGPSRKFQLATFRLKQGYNSLNPGGYLCLPTLGPLGAGFSRNFAAADAASKKPIVPGLADSLKDMCFRYCYCRLFVASAVITVVMRCVQSLRSSESSPDRKSPLLNGANQNPIVALHRRIPPLHCVGMSTAAILAKG